MCLRVARCNVFVCLCVCRPKLPRRASCARGRKRARRRRRRSAAPSTGSRTRRRGWPRLSMLPSRPRHAPASLASLASRPFSLLCAPCRLSEAQGARKGQQSESAARQDNVVALCASEQGSKESKSQRASGEEGARGAKLSPSALAGTSWPSATPTAGGAERIKSGRHSGSSRLQNRGTQTPWRCASSPSSLLPPPSFLLPPSSPLLPQPLPIDSFCLHPASPLQVARVRAGMCSGYVQRACACQYEASACAVWCRMCCAACAVPHVPHAECGLPTWWWRREREVAWPWAQDLAPRYAQALGLDAADEQRATYWCVQGGAGCMHGSARLCAHARGSTEPATAPCGKALGPRCSPARCRVGALSQPSWRG